MHLCLYAAQLCTIYCQGNLEEITSLSERKFSEKKMFSESGNTVSLSIRTAIDLGDRAMFSLKGNLY